MRAARHARSRLPSPAAAHVETAPLCSTAGNGCGNSQWGSSPSPSCRSSVEPASTVAEESDCAMTASARKLRSGQNCDGASALETGRTHLSARIRRAFCFCMSRVCRLRAKTRHSEVTRRQKTGRKCCGVPEESSELSNIMKPTVLLPRFRALR
jgi:hypothetical protein